MTFKEKVIKYLEEFIDDKFCDYATGRDIRVFILPYIQNMQEDPVSDDIDQAAEDYGCRGCALYAEDDEGDLLEISNVREAAFKAGAQWQKDQMMKDAEEHENEVMRLRAKLRDFGCEL